MKTALITGINGQDGSYLAELLLSKGYEVHGLVRRHAVHEFRNIDHLLSDITLHYGDLSQEHYLCSLLSELKPNEIYNMAAQSDVQVSFQCPEYTADITGLGVLRLLEAIRVFSPYSKLYQASTSEMFGNCPPPQTETSPLIPRNPYGVAKLFAHRMVDVYRKAYDIYASCGILFNHESERRGANFVTQKICLAAARSYYGSPERLRLGNLDAQRDWGYAPDYMRAAWMMLQQEKPDDFVIATGVEASVRTFAQLAFAHVDLDWTKYVDVDQSFMRPLETVHLCGNASKAEKVLGWVPEVNLGELVKRMMDNALITQEPRK